MAEHDEDLTRLGQFIKTARRDRYGTVQAAVKAAEMNTMTWSKAERGEPIREDRLTAIEKALGWDVGDGKVIAHGGQPRTSRPVAPRVGGPSLAHVSDEDLVDELRRRLAVPDPAVLGH